METPVVLAVALVAAVGGAVLGVVARSMWASQTIKAAQAEARRIEALGVAAEDLHPITDSPCPASSLDQLDEVALGVSEEREAHARLRRRARAHLLGRACAPCALEQHVDVRRGKREVAVTAGRQRLEG